MPKSQENQIDPTLESMKEFSKISKNTAVAIQKMRHEAIFSDGILPAKMKAAIATIWSISAKCEPCLRYYVVKAKELGLSEAELGEILAVGCAMGGCVGEMWEKCGVSKHTIRLKKLMKSKMTAVQFIKGCPC